MFLHSIWFMMMASSLVYAGLNGKMGEMLNAALKGGEKAIGLTIGLGAGYLLFCGLIEIARALEVPRKVEKLIRPLLRRLMPHVRESETFQAVALNLSMNLLGAGNAATPLGMEAVRRMDQESTCCPQIRHDLYMLLILNATSIQLLPTTILTLRAAAGSANVNAVLLPTLLCTGISTMVGAGSALCLRKWREKKDGQ